MTDLTHRAEDWATLEAFLLEDEGLSAEEIRQDLESQGVNVSALIERARETARKTVQAQWRQEAEKERSLRVLREKAIQLVFSWPLDKVREWLQQAEAGLIGPQTQAAARSCYKGKKPGELSEEELRSAIVDIFTSVGQESKNAK